MIICDPDPQAEFGFYRVNLRGPIVLGDKRVRIIRSVEHSIASEVLSQRRAVQEARERFETLGCPEETVD